MGLKVKGGGVGVSPIDAAAARYTASLIGNEVREALAEVLRLQGYPVEVKDGRLQATT